MVAERWIDDLEAMLLAASRDPIPLLILAGLPETGKSFALTQLAATRSQPPISLGETLAASLVSVSPPLRGLRALSLVDALLPHGAQPTFIDDIELLFLPSLSLRPLAMLRDLARRSPVIATWPLPSERALHDLQHRRLLTYATAGHPEHTTEDVTNLHVFTTPWPTGPRP